MIEVNQRGAMLEEMARGLFDEWFVRFRFPAIRACLSSTHGMGFAAGVAAGGIGKIVQPHHRITDGAHHSPASAPNGMLMASVRDRGSKAVWTKNVMMAAPHRGNSRSGLQRRHLVR